MIFLTVGTQFPFDRLTKALDEVMGQKLLDEEVFGQIGDSKYQPSYFEAVSFLDTTRYTEQMRKSSKIISHAGMGSIIAALDLNKPLLVMPRLKKYKEAVNDHQLDISRKFEELGHILVAYKAEDIPAKLDELKTFVPRKRENQVEQVAKRIQQFLNELARRNK